MIIFDLDGTLANCEHRRHFVDPSKDPNATLHDGKWFKKSKHPCGGLGKKWEPDWKSFYEACDKDTIILPVAFQFYALRSKFGMQHKIEIWSGRCESVKEKTIEWLEINFSKDIDWNIHLKMRPIGDYTPDDQLKERWLDEYIESMYPALHPDKFGETIYRKPPIEMVFDDRPKVVRMYRRRGIFVFDCNQTGEEF